MITAGLISDTHGLLRPEALAALNGVDHIIHAGDVGRASILDALRDIAPLTVVRGNVDGGAWAEALPADVRVSLDNCNVYILHNLADLSIEPQAADIQVVIYGHTHKPAVERRAGVLYVNPGSAGPRRFALPISLGYLRISGNGPAEAWTKILDV